MENKFERSIGFIGEDLFGKITRKTLVIFGLGGVGGTCFESLLRTGFTKFKIIDFDCVSASNMNRQILYVEKDIGKVKVECALNKAKSINPNVEVEVFNMKASEDTVSLVGDADFIIDAIDDVNGKIAIAKYAQNKNIPLVVSLGMANRIDPTKVSIIKLNQTSDDPLAKKVRYEFKKNDIDISKVYVAFSKETPKKDGTKLNSLMFVPSAAGLSMAHYVIQTLIDKESN